MRKKIKEYALISLGITLVAAGVYFFLIPSNLAIGGVSGLAMIINNYLPVLSIGLIMFILNGILFAAAFIIIGPEFGGKTIYASLGLSGIILFFENTFPNNKPIADDLLLVLLFGILISGIGMGIVFNQDASTGGTDIIAKIINKFFHVDIGKALLMSDFIITFFAGIAFGAQAGMYALLGLIINGFVIDGVIDGMNICKHVMIISSEGQMIKDFIINDLKRGVTIYDAKGAYSGETKEVLITVVSRKQFIRLREFIKAIDKKAFIAVSEVHEVLGEGFSEIDK